MPKDAEEGFSLYGGTDPADLPRYNYVDAERATGVPASTVGVWVRGMHFTRPSGGSGFYAPVIARPSDADKRLSFNNLLEVNVLRALRTGHEVKLKDVRGAIEQARIEYGIERLLINPRLCTSGGKLFLDLLFKVVDLSQSQQFAMRAVLEHSLRRVQVDENLRQSYAPLPRGTAPHDTRPILLSPYVSFGNAIIKRRGISTSAIRSRFDLGEERAAIISDYGLNEEEFAEAILYEQAA